MHNAELADQIISKLLTYPRGSQVPTKELSDSLHALQDDVVDCINAIHAVKPHFFRLGKGPGISRYVVMIQSANINDIHSFVYNGGFVGEIKATEIARTKEDKLRDLQIEHFPVVTAQAKKAIEDSGWAKGISWLSLLIATLALFTPFILDRCQGK